MEFGIYGGLVPFYYPFLRVVPFLHQRADGPRPKQLYATSLLDLAEYALTPIMH
jgi:hypothetical protein